MNFAMGADRPWLMCNPVAETAALARHAGVGILAGTEVDL